MVFQPILLLSKSKCVWSFCLQKQMQNERSRHLREIDELNKKHQQEVADLSKRLEVECLLKQDFEKRLQEFECLIKQNGRNEVLECWLIKVDEYERPILVSAYSCFCHIYQIGDQDQNLLLAVKLQNESQLREQAEKQLEEWQKQATTASQDTKEEVFILICTPSLCGLPTVGVLTFAKLLFCSRVWSPFHLIVFCPF